MRLLQEMRKNILTLWRSPAALATLVIGPLALLFMVGVALSQADPHDINVGVVGPLPSAFVSNASVLPFEDAESCVRGMKDREVLLCVEFGTLSEGIVPQGTVVYHLDDTREDVSTYVLQEFAEQLGQESSRIRVGAVGKLLDEFARIASVLSLKRAELVQVRQDVLSLQSDITKRRQSLEEQQIAYRAAALPLKELATEIQAGIQVSIDGLDSTVMLLRNATDELDALSDENFTIDTSYIKASLSGVEANIDGLRQDQEDAAISISQLKDAIDSFDVQLDEEINASRKYENSTAEAVARIDATVLEIDSDLQELAKLDPSLAKAIDNPITTEVMTLFDGLRPIELGFGQLFIIVVMFISTLFGTIVTLLEINSRAVLRNSLAPSGEAMTIAATAITAFLAVALQAGVLLAVAQFMLGVDVSSALPQFITAGLMVSLAFILVGTAIALRFRRPQSSILVATFVALLALLFSDVLAPLEFMPKAIAQMVGLNPLVIASQSLTQAQLFGMALSNNTLLVLAGWLALAFIACGVAYERYLVSRTRW